MRAQHDNAVRVALAYCLLFAFCALTATAVGVAQVKKEKGVRSPAPSPPALMLQQPVGAESDAPLIINTDLVTITVSVTDRDGHHINNLDRSLFTVYDDKAPQQISFFSDADAPASICVILDNSGSMSGDKIIRAREALARFIETSHPQDEYFLISFDDRAQLQIDRTRDTDAVLSKFTYVQPHGSTALYDAAYLGIEKVTRGSHAKRAILLISDGQDNNSRYTFSELRRRLQEADVLIYAIGIQPGRGGYITLDELASASGGRAFFPDSAAEMNEAFERIALELRHQYSVGFRPSDFIAGDGKWHRLKVKVQPPDGLSRLFIRSRKGYYATPNSR